MIDVWSVAANSLWILGLSLLLATLSWAHWVARQEEAPMREVLGRAGLRIPVDVGLLLFCAGLAATSRRWWERVLWGLLGAAWAVQAGLAVRDLTGGSATEARDDADGAGGAT